MSKELVLKYKGTQRSTGEDLFETVTERRKGHRVYIRQECSDKDFVLWLTATKWEQGYEASSPLRGNVLVKVVDKHGKVIFEEHNGEREDGRIFPGLKLYPMSWEYIADIERAMMSKFGLKSFDEWKKWLLEKKDTVSYQGDDDSWLYSQIMTVSSSPAVIFEFYLYGMSKLKVVKEAIVHKIAATAFEEFQIDAIDDEYSGTIGFLIKEE